MWTSQLFHLGIVVIALLSKVAVSQQDDSTLQEKLIDQLYKDYFEWKYTVWSPEAGKTYIMVLFKNTMHTNI